MRLLKGFHAEVGKPLLLMFENLAQCIVFPKFLEKKKKKQLFSATQSGFCSNNSFENLLPSTTHRIYTNISLWRF